jgi:hypothetical protein
MISGKDNTGKGIINRDGLRFEDKRNWRIYLPGANEIK